MEKLLRSVEKVIPKPIFNYFQPAYHRTLAFSSALLSGFPSRKIKVIGVTGTKGKSSTTEIITAILEQAGHKTALSNTIRFKIGNESTENLYKMSMPGRFFVQKFIKKAVDAKCEYLVLEMTSQGVLQSRHKHIELDALVFTNLSPEHIESHGSYEKYVDAKVEIAREMKNSHKPNRLIVANGDDKEASKFLACDADKKVEFKIKNAEPYSINAQGIDFTFAGKKVHSPLSGLFNLYNILAAATLARNLGISDAHIIETIEKFNGIKGRVEKIEAGQDFEVVVDYAHTIDSLEKFYTIFEGKKKICVLGGTGGGRDAWKRKGMGEIADTYCNEIILTNEDPYDEDPKQIINDVAQGITSKKPHIIMDRREAIQKAITVAQKGDAVLITGKGTDPYIMGPKGSKIPWSDAKIARESIEKLSKKI